MMACQQSLYWGADGLFINFLFQATSLLRELDTQNLNVIVVSPRNYFLFTPLLPSCTTGTIELRSIMQPIRFLTRFKTRVTKFIEADCTEIDHLKKEITVVDNSGIQLQLNRFRNMWNRCKPENKI
jgi:NADH dehydrogenase FAD-containing subunit